MNRLKIVAFAATALIATASLAQQASPVVGLWKNIDDHTGKPKALIRITENNGEIKGKIEKLYREAGEEAQPKCDKCDDERKDQPVIGMTILTGMKQDGGEFNGGKILDPNNGKVYRSKMTLVEGGKKLNVRGYIGMPMIGRTQVWVRQDDSAQ